MQFVIEAKVLRFKLSVALELFEIDKSALDIMLVFRN